ncbi:hypothetical protein B296_00028158, partial [Ensete ventricosum]
KCFVSVALRSETLARVGSERLLRLRLDAKNHSSSSRTADLGEALLKEIDLEIILLLEGS